jgi:hypothetical protein
MASNYGYDQTGHNIAVIFHFVIPPAAVISPLKVYRYFCSPNSFSGPHVKSFYPSAGEAAFIE